MSVKLAQLRSFIALADTKSFHRASELVCRSQPAVSAQIKELEKVLGVSLVFRHNRLVSLTAEGEAFLGHLRRVMRDLDELIGEVGRIAQLESGEVKVGAAPTLAVYILPQVVRGFRAAYPRVRVRFSDENTPQLEKLVDEKVLDFYFGPQPAPSSALRFEPVAEDDYIVLVGSDHPFARRSAVRVEELAGEQWLMLKSGTSVRREVEQFLIKNDLSVQCVEEVANHFTLGGMIANGCGISMLPSTGMPLTSQPDIVALPLADARLTRVIGLAHRHDYMPSPPAQAFIDMMVPLVRKHSTSSKTHNRLNRPGN